MAARPPSSSPESGAVDPTSPAAPPSLPPTPAIHPKDFKMAEEHRCQEGHRLCSVRQQLWLLLEPRNDGTMDLCSKYYCGLRFKEERASSATIAIEKSLLGSSSPSPSSSIASSPSVSPSEPSYGVRTVVAAPVAAAKEDGQQVAAHNPGRCAACRKRVGLVGFRCQCGATYCGSNQSPEQHGCAFDFRAAGREEIARVNPIIKADKLDDRI